MRQIPATNNTRTGGPLSKTEMAYQVIREKITTHQVSPGHRIVLAQIAEEIDSSVVPVREAIRQLEAEGLVTFERNVGARVSMVDRTTYLDCMQTLAILEGAATRLAAPHLGEKQLAEAKALNNRMRDLLDNFDARAFTEMNRQFHRILFAACPNLHFTELVEAEWERLDYLRESIFSFVPERAHTSVREHEMLVDLIAMGADADYIEKVARQHRKRTLERYLERKTGAQATPTPGESTATGQ
ncbi:GntR family transcriptional regulator [Corynebacterium mendelii]|uniref:GntR family transcriptional regulator n=1 Tax=Corynebacterium mendelii TaxID=2765362 RepID=UPI002ED0FA67